MTRTVTISHLVRQSGGERQQQPGLVMLLATCFASRIDIANAAGCPSPSPRTLATALAGRRTAEGRRWVRVAGDTHRRPTFTLTRGAA